MVFLCVLPEPPWQVEPRGICYRCDQSGQQQKVILQLLRCNLRIITTCLVTLAEGRQHPVHCNVAQHDDGHGDDISRCLPFPAGPCPIGHQEANHVENNRRVHRLQQPLVDMR
ncbi:Os06g0294100 [Oryza sativa Japonica Group]|uniref:Os06g0294100 protein n=1 Tax=Oryza sativa subsp. japonica TaxID=39947 RepID=A0A0P0WVK9_ORYSJ|nr:hypothetical protein EE612_033471 [Oryza sativa]BAS97324.1 Os06g0294100 [Oryza sativa Japonica Group]